jgi:hypothetical protein
MLGKVSCLPGAIDLPLHHRRVGLCSTVDVSIGGSHLVWGRVSYVERLEVQRFSQTGKRCSTCFRATYKSPVCARLAAVVRALEINAIVEGNVDEV